MKWKLALKSSAEFTVTFAKPSKHGGYQERQKNDNKEHAIRFKRYIVEKAALSADVVLAFYVDVPVPPPTVYNSQGYDLTRKNMDPARPSQELLGLIQSGRR
jgi:hypothetical protein